MAELMDYKCPACGGALEFDPKLQKMKCPYCDSVFDMSELLGKDEQLNNTVNPDAPEIRVNRSIRKTPPPCRRISSTGTPTRVRSGDTARPTA